jgi:hypothetical protein
MMKSQLLTALFAVAFLVGCQTAPQRSFAPAQDYVPTTQIRIEPKFPTVALTKENLDSEARRCVVTLPSPATSVENVKSRLPIPNNETIALGHASSASNFIITRNLGFCVHFSEQKFAIVAAEALSGTVNANGVPPDVLASWHQQIAKQLATNGLANVVYVMNNGNAFAAKYWFSDQPPKYGISYSNEFKRAGTWENDRFDLRFKDNNMQGVGTTQRNGKMQKTDLLNH